MSDEPIAPGPGAPAETSAEAEGETVGEAKWAALRQLEQRFPGLDKSKVELVVVSEGERGLLGIGFTPARVIARLTGPPGAAPPPRRPAARPEPGRREPLSAPGETLRAVLELVRDALELDASVTVREDDGVLTGTFHGRELGLVIGKRGQTIDAVQYLASSAVHRASRDDTEVVVDAAGYRERRRATLEGEADAAAERAVATGGIVALDPMSAAERKIVHLRLQERDDVATSSEGNEPGRYVVVHPVR